MMDISGYLVWAVSRAEIQEKNWVIHVSFDGHWVRCAGSLSFN